MLSALAAGAATFVGVFIGIRKNYGDAGIAFGSAFAAIIMILISAFELMPAAWQGGGALNAVLFMVLGTAILALANLLIPHLHTIEEMRSCDHKCLAQASYLIVIGMILHDFPEGFAISSSFDHSATLGLILFLSAFVHNIPEGYTMTIGGVLGRGFYLRSAFLSSIVTFGGAVLGVVLLKYFGFLLSAFLAFAAGAMLYISGHELLPLAMKYKEKKALLGGIVSAALIFFLLSII